MKKSFADILSEQIRQTKAKMAKKVPEWAEYELEFPSKLCTEQCSSSATARYKAALVSRIMQENGMQAKPHEGGKEDRTGEETVSECCKPRVADITGGLGVDSWAFASVAEEVLHNEMDVTLSQAVRKNFQTIGLKNVTHSGILITEETAEEALAGFRPDIIFADPARREAGSGKKVFRLEDCSPDILSLKDTLLKICPDIVIKLSPMADITLVCRQLGECVREVHVLGAGGAAGECKELLVWMRRGWTGGFSITVADAGHNCRKSGSDDAESLVFKPSDEANAIVNRLSSLQPGDLLIEPSAALMKAGCFTLISERFSLPKLGAFTHLYVGKELPPSLRRFCKCYRILELLPLDKASMKESGRRYIYADVSARNIHMSSEELRKRMGISSGDSSIHIFGCHTDALGGRLLITEKVAADDCRPLRSTSGDAGQTPGVYREAHQATPSKRLTFTEKHIR